MEARSFGNSSLSVSPLGLGAGLIGGGHIQEVDAGKLLQEALELGVRLIDTGPAYGLSEERIGRHLAHRRDDFVLCARYAPAGVSIPGESVATLQSQVEASLARMKTEHLDLLLVSGQGDEFDIPGQLIEFLEGLVKAGKVRIAGFSGANGSLDAALALPALGAVEVSVNVFDQRGFEAHVIPASARGMGVLVKRPVANAPWLYEERPHNPLVEGYWDRMKAMGFQPGDLTWPEIAIRFAAHQAGVGCAIFGTANVRQLARQVEWVDKGPLPAEIVDALVQAFKAADRDWVSLN